MSQAASQRIAAVVDAPAGAATDAITGAGIDVVPASEATARVAASVARVVRWLDAYGETSYDFQTFYAGRLGRRAKALYYSHPAIGVCAVAPIIFCEAFVPQARRLFFVPQRFPIADAHYAMGFARLFRSTGDRKHLARASHFLEVLLSTACRGRSGDGWGYPFDWVTVDGVIPTGTPLITTLPYVYEAFAAVHESDGQGRWLDVMRSIANHALRDYPEHPTRPGVASAGYNALPSDRGRVVNASAYRAFLLHAAARDLQRAEYADAAEPNLRFVIESQNEDGSWYYAMDGRRHFIDHFHTCFVLKALLKIERLTGRRDCQRAIEAGLRYYVRELFDAEGLPRPFAKPPRFIVYRRELYDYAECLNVATLAGDRWPGVQDRAARALDDLLTRWQRADGSFRTRQLLAGWDNVPMHRWAQAQLFRSLCGMLPRTAPSGCETGNR